MATTEFAMHAFCLRAAYYRRRPRPAPGAEDAMGNDEFTNAYEAAAECATTVALPALAAVALMLDVADRDEPEECARHTAELRAWLERAERACLRDAYQKLLETVPTEPVLRAVLVGDEYAEFQTALAVVKVDYKFLCNAPGGALPHHDVVNSIWDRTFRGETWDTLFEAAKQFEYRGFDLELSRVSDLIDRIRARA